MAGAASRGPVVAPCPRAEWGAGPAPGSVAAAPVALRRRTDASCRTAGEGGMLADKPGLCMFHQLLLPFPFYFFSFFFSHSHNVIRIVIRCLVS